MTQRGGQGRVAMRPTTPPAPDSLSVPQRKVFTTVRSVGPGAVADIRSRIRPLHELQRPAVFAAEYQLLLDAVDSAARACRDDESEPSNDPTWGFRVFVTSFSPASREKLPNAIANLIQAQQLVTQQIRTAGHGEEVFKRFKLDIVEDESLEHASDDRVREEFRAWMKGLNLTNEQVEDYLSVCGIASQHICLVLDKATITMLAELTFEDPKLDAQRSETITARVIDGNYRRPAEVKVDETYRGIGDVSILQLGRLFEVMSTEAGFTGLGHLYVVHPLDGMPEIRR